MKPITMLALACLLSPLPATAKDNAANDHLNTILAGEHRSPEHRARDRYRHPLETLAFFEMTPGMTVVEIFPGGGWYTEILAPYVKGKGKLYAAGFDETSDNRFLSQSAKRFQAKLTADPDRYGEVSVTVLAPPTKTAIAPAGSADRVLTFRNVHNWMAAGTAETVFAAMFKALKPGGLLGLVEHRGAEGAEQDPRARSGYVSEAHVIELAEAAGFKLLATSEINANPKDRKDYEQGVWTLPPTLRLKDKDRAQYLTIGESDRMTLKFIKPQP